MSETLNIVEDNSNEPLFLPNIWEQINNMDSKPAEENKPAGETTTQQSKPSEVVFEVEDVQDAISIPFDLAAIITKYKGFELSPDQATRLGKRWLRPFQRWFGTTEGMDIYLALAATVTIITDKSLDYLEQRQRAKEKHHATS